MYTHFHMVITYLNKDVLHRKTMCFLIVFLFSFLVYGQSEKERNDIGEIYQARLAEHLFPNIDTLIANEIALFYSKPSFEPEYSIRIVERGDQFDIEGRFLEENLWSELLERFINQDKKPFSVKVSLNSMQISSEFKERVVATFENLIHCNRTIDDSDNVQFDGISYVFIIFDKSDRVNTIETDNPKPGTLENDLANLFTQMANDLKTQSFNEAKYRAMLNTF